MHLRGSPARPDGEPRPPLDEAALTDTLTAIRIWMGRSIPGGLRNWTRRVAFCRSGLAQLGFNDVREQCRADARRIAAPERGHS